MRMDYDLPLILVALFAGATTFLVIAVHIMWLALKFALRERGCRLTLLHHNWTRINTAIASVDAPKERQRYEKWSAFVRFMYVTWLLAMFLFALLGFFVFG